MSVAVLCVDDEPAMLVAYQRFLGPGFAVASATGAEAALELMASGGPFAVVVSDLQMPGMDGVRLLAAIRDRYPDTVRVLLTGGADLDRALRAVNEGHVFQFLTKPCPPTTFAKAVAAAAAQHRLIISDRLRVEEALRASEELSRAVLDSVLSHIAVLDRAGTIVAVNTAWRRFAAPPGQVARAGVGTNYLEVCRAAHGPFSEDAPAVADGIQAVLTGGREWFGIEYSRHAPDRQQWFLMSVTPLNAAGGGAVVSHTDITERKQAEVALRASEERYRQLFEANPHPMWVCDAATLSFLAVNDAAVRHYGYPRSTFLAMTGRDIELPAQAEPGSPPRHGPAGRIRHHRLGSGEVRQVEVAAHPIEFEGRAACLVLALDVTERKLLEEQLRQSQKLESVGQLAAGIAHEINTPIQYIGDNTNFLGGAFRDVGGVIAQYRAAGADPARLAEAARAAEEAELDYLLEEAPRAIGQTLDGVQHVARIVKAMKEFAHPGTGEKTPVDLNRTVETVITVARNEWKYAAEVVTDLEPGLTPVRGLPGELNQVFLNLLVNAAHAVQAAGGEEGTKGAITFSTRRAGDTVEVRVTDTGCGIPEAIRGRIFDPFFTTKPVGQGTGQGLSLAHAVVVQRHGGTITFESKVGRGTTFVVRLPVDGSRATRPDLADALRPLPGVPAAAAAGP